MTRPSLRLLPLLILLLTAGLAGAEPRWQFDAGDKIVGKPTVAGDRIYLAAGRTLFALGLDGQELWQRQLEGTVAATVRVVDEVLYVHSSQGLHALDLTGEPLWTFADQDLGPLVDGRTWGWGTEILADPWGWYRSAPLVDGDTVFFGSSGGLHAVSRTTGEARWQVPIGPVTADPTTHEDLVIVASWNNSVYGVAKETGDIRWRFRAPIPASKGIDWIGYAGFHLTPVVDGGRVYVGNRGTFFYALDADDGTEAWSSKVGSSWMGSPAVVSEDSVYYGLSDGKAVLGHVKASGALSFFFKTGSLVFAQPALHGKKLIVGTLAGHLFAVDTESGDGERLLALGPDAARYEEYFTRVPEDLTRYQATEWTIDTMLTESNAILNLTLDGSTVYLASATGVLSAVDLGPP